MRLGVGLILIYLVGILATETILQILRILRILQLKLRVQLVGSRAAGTWIYRGLIPALLKQLNQFNEFYSTAQRHFQQGGGGRPTAEARKKCKRAHGRN